MDPQTFRIVDHFKTGALPQHVTPSWDLKKLWVLNDLGNSLTPINPRNGHHGKPVHVDDPYNMYYTPDGKYAIVVAEQLQRLDFRKSKSMKLSTTCFSKGVRRPGLASRPPFFCAGYFFGTPRLLTRRASSVTGSSWSSTRRSM